MSYRDVVVTLRSLRRDARISATAVALLALGLGANAAIFAAADQILLRPPAGVDHPEQLRRFYRSTRQTIDQAVQTRAGFSYRHYDELRTALGERAELAAYVRDSLFLGDDAQAKVRASYVTGSYFGSARPREDFPRMLALYAAGKLKLDELITRRYKIDEAPQAFADLESGKNARGVIVF